MSEINLRRSPAMSKFFTSILMATLGAMNSAFGESIYRSEDSQGRVTYSSSPMTNAKQVEKFMPRPGPSEKQILESDQRITDLTKRTDEMEQARKERKKLQSEREQRARQERVEQELGRMRRNPPPVITQYPPGNPYNQPYHDNARRFYQQNRDKTKAKRKPSQPARPPLSPIPGKKTK